MQETTDEDIAVIIRVCQHGKTCMVYNFVGEDVDIVHLDEAPEWLRDIEAIATVADEGKLYWAALDTDMRLVRFLDIAPSPRYPTRDAFALMLKLKQLEIKCWHKKYAYERIRR